MKTTTQADQYRELLADGMRGASAKEVMEYAAGRWKGDAYLPVPGESYDPDPLGVWKMTEEEYISFLEGQPALPEDENVTGPAAETESVPVGAGNRS